MRPQRVGSAAVARAITESRRPSQDWEAMCLRFVRTCFGVPARYPYATDAWEHTEKRHGTDDTPPAAVPVWWTGGRWGHVALSAGGGFCWSNDILRRGRIDKVRISTITTRWGMRYRGWTEDINDADVYRAPEPELRVFKVRMSALNDAARRDPSAPQGVASHAPVVRVIERALVAEGLLDDRWAGDGAWGTKTEAAWRRWQRRLGHDRPSGVPGRRAVEALAERHGFEVVP